MWTGKGTWSLPSSGTETFQELFFLDHNSHSVYPIPSLRETSPFDGVKGRRPSATLCDSSNEKINLQSPISTTERGQDGGSDSERERRGWRDLGGQGFVPLSGVGSWETGVESKRRTKDVLSTTLHEVTVETGHQGLRPE